MDGRAFVAGSLAGLSAPIAAVAQRTGTVQRIGFLRVGQPPTTWLEAFRQGLRERDYREGHDVVLDLRVARSALELPDLATELTRRKVDVIVASGTPSVVPAKNATRTIPVVFVAAIDPVAAGVTTGLAQPGGNVTGITAMHADLVAKRLGLLKELLPKVSRFAVLARAASPATVQYVKEAEQAAQTSWCTAPNPFHARFERARLPFRDDPNGQALWSSQTMPSSRRTERGLRNSR